MSWLSNFYLYWSNIWPIVFVLLFKQRNGLLWPPLLKSNILSEFVFSLFFYLEQQRLCSDFRVFFFFIFVLPVLVFSGLSKQHRSEYFKCRLWNVLISTAARTLGGAPSRVWRQGGKATQAERRRRDWGNVWSSFILLNQMKMKRIWFTVLCFYLKPWALVHQWWKKYFVFPLK